MVGGLDGEIMRNSGKKNLAMLQVIMPVTIG